MNAVQIEVSDGTLVNINVGIEYFKQADIRVYLDGSAVALVEGVDYQWNSATVIHFLTGPVANGVTVYLRRTTEIDEMYNIYDGGAPFSRITLDENFNQLKFLAQEVREGVGLDGLIQPLSMGGFRIVNLGDPIDSKDAANKQFVDESIAAIVATGSGDFNAAVNVNYVKPDLTTTNLQALSSATGTSMVGHGAGSLADKLTAMDTDRGTLVRQAATIAALKLFQGRFAGDICQVARQLAGYDFGGGPFYWDAASVATANDIYIVQVTGVTTGRWIRLGKEVYISQFGAKAQTGFDNATAFLAAANFLAAEEAAKRPVPTLYFEQGKYETSSSPNWAIQGATILNLGKVKIRGTGTGIAWDLAGPIGSNVTHMTVGQGMGFIVENPSTAVAATIRIRSCYLSEFRMRCWGGGVTQAGFSILGCVLSKFWIGTTPTESTSEPAAEYVNGWYASGTGTPAKPTFGKIVDEASALFQSAYNVFYDYIGAACQYGMYIISTLGNLWEGGDCEYNTTNGCSFTGAAFLNRIRGMNFEVNTTRDVECAGNYNSFDCDSVNFVISGGSGNRLIGGTHDQITILGGTGAYVGEVVYGRGLSGNLVISDSGVRTAYGMCYQAQLQTWSRGPKIRANVVVGASPFTYTNTRGMAVRVFLSGGTVSNTSYFRGGTLVAAIGTSNTWVEVSPGDQLSITYTVAPTITEMESA